MTAPRRRWFRFGLRTLFVALTIVGGWLGYQLNWIHERNAFLRKYNISQDLLADSEVQPPGLVWLLGERGYGYLDIVARSFSSSEYEEALRLFPEATVHVCTLFEARKSDDAL